MNTYINKGKRVLKHIIHNFFSLSFMMLFAVLMLQPHKFEADFQKNNSEYVLAAYENMLESGAPEDGSISFENLIVGEDGNTKITYIVQAGDTLGKIAKNFGTTSSTIADANGLNSRHTIRPGQRLTITYNEGVIHELKEDMSMKEFATEYDLNLEDLLTLNYIDDEDFVLELGSQLFLDLNKTEAIERGLIEKKQHEMLAVALPTVDEIKEGTQNTLGSVKEDELLIPDEDETAPVEEVEPDQEVQQDIVYNNAQQDVISAEDTASKLQGIEDEKVAAEEAKQQRIEDEKQAKIDAANAKEQREQQAIDQQKAEQLAEKKRQQDVAAAKAASDAAKKAADQNTQLCGENQCHHKGRCYTPPADGICAPNDPNNAWVCGPGYVESGKGCAPEGSNAAQQEMKATPKKKSSTRKEEVIAQWYFNPRQAGFKIYGWGAGHCTEYAAYYRWKNYGINIRDHFRGNAIAWYQNASNAGISVGQTPQKGAIVVMQFGSSGRSSYGHVGIVTDVDRENRYIRIQDANFLGRYVVTDHRVDMDSTKNPVIGYIYP